MDRDVIPCFTRTLNIIINNKMLYKVWRLSLATPLLITELYASRKPSSQSLLEIKGNLLSKNLDESVRNSIYLYCVQISSDKWANILTLILHTATGYWYRLLNQCQMHKKCNFISFDTHTLKNPILFICMPLLDKVHQRSKM